MAPGDEDVGYVRISQFNEQTTSGLKKAIKMWYFFITSGPYGTLAANRV
jgi:hypothetical protein